jgi:putative hydrolase of the HAD superfamily
MKAMIFDLDDTLILEKEYVKSGYQAVSKLLESKLQMESSMIYQLLWQLFEDDSKQVFNRLYEHLKIPYEISDIKNLIKIYREHIPQIELLEDAKETIQILKCRSIKLGIISDGYAITQRNKVDAMKADKIFDKVILTDELGQEFWKPNKKAFELMQQEFQIPFEEMVYVGDNPEKDFYVKKYIPIMTARIYREDGVYKDREYRENIKEDYSLNSLKELLKL